MEISNVDQRNSPKMSPRPGPQVGLAQAPQRQDDRRSALRRSLTDVPRQATEIDFTSLLTIASDPSPCTTTILLEELFYYEQALTLIPHLKLPLLPTANMSD